MSLRSPLRAFPTSLRAPLTSGTSQNSLRYASLNSAIGRGIRRSQSVRDPRNLSDDNRDRSRDERSSFRPRDNRRNKEDHDGFPKPELQRDTFSRKGGFQGLPREYQRDRAPRRFRNENDSAAATRRHSQKYDSTTDAQSRHRAGQGECRRKEGHPGPPAREFDEDEFIRTGNFRALPLEHQRFKSALKPRDQQESRAVNKSRPSSQHSSSPPYPRKERSRQEKLAARHKATEKRPERVKEHVKVPDTIPYTTPASEFIYGTTAVEATLRCSQRQLYKLYLYQGAEEELSDTKVVLRKLALTKNVQVKFAFAEWDRLLDKMSAGRPHNGCILEASPLPRTPVQALKSVELEEAQFRVELAPQTREEASVNGTNDRITINFSAAQQYRRQPVVLLLDGVVDPGNLGAIIRSAYYLGVDAIVFAGRNSAPLSPITIKASAGAAENMTLLEVKNEVEFIQRSKANGWRFYAADALSSDATYLDPTSLYDSNLMTASEGEPAAGSPIGHSPSVIMMGNEGSGLSNHIRSQADSIVSIPGARIIPGVGAVSDPARVDSLNVSVAAALLMETFLRVPLGVSPVPRKQTTR